MPPPTSTLDRQTTTPFLLNLIYKLHSHHPSTSYPLPPDFALPRDRIQIYTWQTCTLRELSHLLTTALPNLIPSPIVGTRLSYRLVYPDAKDAYMSRGATAAKYLTKELGSVVIQAVDEGAGAGAGVEGQEGLRENGAEGSGATRYAGEPEKMLMDARFVIGDFVSVAVYPPGSSGAGGEVSAATGSEVHSGRGRLYSDRGAANGFRGGRGGAMIPPGEWRRGERIPDEGGYGRGGSGGYGRGRGGRW